MKKKTHLHTSFIMFIEKHNKEEKPTDEIEMPDEVQDDEDNDTIEDLMKEYNEMEKKYKALRNIKLQKN